MAVENSACQVLLETSAWVHKQAVMFQDVLGILPLVEDREVVAADDEIETVLGPAVAHEVQAVRGVVRLG